MTPHLQLVDGSWIPAIGGGTWELVDPATERVVDRVPFGDARDATAAVDAAAAALPSWSATNPYRRAAVLEQAAAIIRERAD